MGRNKISALGVSSPKEVKINRRRGEKGEEREKVNDYNGQYLSPKPILKCLLCGPKKFMSFYSTMILSSWYHVNLNYIAWSDYVNPLPRCLLCPVFCPNTPWLCRRISKPYTLPHHLWLYIRITVWIDKKLICILSLNKLIVFMPPHHIPCSLYVHACKFNMFIMS